MTDPELWKVLEEMKAGRISRAAAMKCFGISREDINQAVETIELMSRVHAAKN